jgi:hypothetical protein
MLAELLGLRLRQLRAAPQNDDGCARDGEPRRDRATEDTVSAGDDGDASVERVVLLRGLGSVSQGFSGCSEIAMTPLA